ncbi:MAG: nitroreductase [Clostridia bacterium]|nr:nitroreductase [Clostridia bacterium]
MSKDLIDAVVNRHSVRWFLDEPISKEIVNRIEDEIKKINEEENLHIQFIINDASAFDTIWAKYGKFKNVKNYIALVGEKGIDLYEKVGYFGERLVLLAQSLGLNSCWVGLSYSKRKAKIKVNKNEKLVLVIALGVGEKQGVPHKSKAIEKIVSTKTETPEWFNNGVKLAMLAPTALNQQKFKIFYDDGKVVIKSLLGPYSKVDLGIVKYHFELGAGIKHFKFK